MKKMSNRGVEQHYKKLFVHQGNDFRFKNLRKLVLKYFKPGSVLDYGCGTGHLSLELLKNGHSVTVYDISKSMLNLTKKYLEDNGYSIPCTQNKGQISGLFDNIVSLDVLEHIQNDVPELQDMHRILRPKGRLILSVPAHAFLYGKRDIEVGHYRRYDKKELIKKIRSAGFIIRKVRYWNMLLFLPFLIQKIVNKRLSEEFRYRRSPITLLLDKWFQNVENKLSLGFGLSLIIIAEKG